MTRSFVVAGRATKGSTVSFIGRDKIVTKPDSSQQLRDWTKACGWAARRVRVPMAKAGIGVRIEVTYELAAPKRCRRTTPCVRPDVDKLARALLDALTGIAYEDDGQVVELLVRKVYGPATLARVTVQWE